MLTLVCSKDDFFNCDINKITSLYPPQECFSFCELFNKKLSEDQNLTSEGKEILQLFLEISKVMFMPHTDDLYRPILQMEGRRSFNIEDLTEIDLSFLDLIVEEITNHELKARIADILWIRNKSHQKAKIALKSFLESGSCFLKNGVGVSSGNQFLNRFLRATQIALSMKDQYHLTLIAKDVKRLIEDASNTNAQEKDYLIFCFLKVLSATKIEDQFCSDFIEKYLNQTTNIHDKDRICKIGIEIAKRSKHIDKINDFYRIQAKAKFEEAKRFEIEHNYIGANSYLKDALDIMQNVNPFLESDKILRTEWQNLLTEVNKKVCENMEEISVSIETPDLMKECDEKLEIIKKYQSSLPDTLYVFTRNNITKFDEAIKEAEESLNDSVFRRIFQTATFDKDSKEIKSSASAKDEAVKNLQIYWGFSRELIEKIRKHIIENFKPDDMAATIAIIIENNPLVSSGRKKQIFQGIFSGFYGDWIISSHLIPAQIEEMLRKRLREKGKYQLKTKPDSTQQERDINDLLSDGEYRNLLNNDEYLNVDLLFNLEAILIHKCGENLRNDCYHGLYDDKFYDRPSNIYLWWIFLKILIDAKCKLQQMEQSVV